MNTTQASTLTRFKVGIFTIVMLVFIGGLTVYVNDKPFWWRSCQLVHINVDDATGLKMKSAVRSLGLQIGYLESVELTETYVRLGICITAQVEVLPSTRAYIRGEGFLGDKFVELKPVKYVGPPPKEIPAKTSWTIHSLQSLASMFEASAQAVDEPPPPVVPPPAADVGRPATTTARRRSGRDRDIPVGEKAQDMQHVVDQVDGLVGEMSSLTTSLKESINPAQLKATMQQLNKTLENASRTLSPEGGLNTTAQRTLAKLEDSIEQLRDLLTRVNKGEGSVGMLLNDPSYAEEIHEAIKNVNRLLSKVSGMKFVVDVGAEQLFGYDGGRGWFKLGIWPRKDRYYQLGISVDPRGKKTSTTVTTQSGGVSTTTAVSAVDPGGIQFTAMLGKVFYERIDLSVGVLYNDGTISAAYNLGPLLDRGSLATLRTDLYARGQSLGLDDRVSLQLKPFINSPVLSSIYLRGGLESFRQVNNRLPFFIGAGLSFDDEDIKILFTLR